MLFKRLYFTDTFLLIFDWNGFVIICSILSKPSVWLQLVFHQHTMNNCTPLMQALMHLQLLFHCLFRQYLSVLIACLFYL